MKELEIKKKELEDQIWELEREVYNQLNYNNVPVENYEKARIALNIRKRLVMALDHVDEVIKQISQNKKT